MNEIYPEDPPSHGQRIHCMISNKFAAFWSEDSPPCAQEICSQVSRWFAAKAPGDSSDPFIVVGHRNLGFGCFTATETSRAWANRWRQSPRCDSLRRIRADRAAPQGHRRGVTTSGSRRNSDAHNDHCERRGTLHRVERTASTMNLAYWPFDGGPFRLSANHSEKQQMEPPTRNAFGTKVRNGICRRKSKKCEHKLEKYIHRKLKQFR